MQYLLKISAVIDMINEAAGRFMSWLTILMVAVVFVVVLLRYTMGLGWIWMQELYVWLHATTFMLGAAYTLLHDGHVRIDLIYRGATKTYKDWINLLGCIFLAGPLIWVLFDRSLPMVMRSWNMGERSAEAGGLPALYLLKSVIIGFCILLALQVLSLALRSLVGVLQPEKSQ